MTKSIVCSCHGADEVGFAGAVAGLGIALLPAAISPQHLENVSLDPKAVSAFIEFAMEVVKTHSLL